MRPSGWMAALLLAALAACGSRPEPEATGALGAADRVRFDAAAPRPEDEVATADWAGPHLPDDRADNMIRRAPHAEAALKADIEARQGAAVAPGAVRLSLREAVDRAAANSSQLRAFGMLPAIRATAVREAEGRFTPEFFAEGRVGRERDRPTSVALTGGDALLRAEETAVEVGVRARLRTGAEVTASQRYSSIETNQTDFRPGEQSASHTALTVVQPLLRGSGLRYNDAPTRIAEIDAKVAQYELLRQAESHLLEVERAYWALAAARKRAKAARALLGRGGSLARSASNRAGIEADMTLGLRARAAAARWRADLARRNSAVRNTQLRLAALIGAPELAREGVELIPVDTPAANRPVDRAALVAGALERRPEVQQAYLQYRAAAIREGVAANEALPELDLILEASLDGRASGRRLGRGGNGEHPSALAGLRFSIPLGHDERRARHERRKLETVMQRHQTVATVESARLDLELSASERRVAEADLADLRAAHASARREARALRARWRDGADAPGAALDALLGAEERAADLQAAIAEAEATLAVADANLARAGGALLERRGLVARPGPGIRDEITYRIRPETP